MSDNNITNEQLDIIRSGVKEWNDWRKENPTIIPNLSGADLSELNLKEINLDEANLSKADLFQSNLSGANLKMAILTGADISDADLTGAALYKADMSECFLTQTNLCKADLRNVNLQKTDLRASNLSEANLSEANLNEANLKQANLTNSNLSHSNITDADLTEADISQSNLTGLDYGDWSNMHGKYFGLRGLDSCFGNALFVRDARDQDFLDTMEREINNTKSVIARKWKRFWFSMWSIIDYGRSLIRVGLLGFIVVVFFGAMYSFDMFFELGMINYPNHLVTWLSPFYFSVVTYTTLGYGDIAPANWIGQFIVIIEVVLGYLTLGLLLAILANKVARRS